MKIYYPMLYQVSVSPPPHPPFPLPVRLSPVLILPPPTFVLLSLVFSIETDFPIFPWLY